MYDFKEQKHIPSGPTESLDVGFMLYQHNRTKKSYWDPTADNYPHPLDFEVHLMVNTNFRWKSYCNFIGLNSANVF